MPVSKKPRKKPLRKSRGGDQNSAMPSLPDRRGVEGMMAGLFEQATDDDPISAAQNVMYRAWEATDRRARIRLAKQALTISPHCADAYVLLAEEDARSVEPALAYYRLGVEAGEKAIGPQGFREYAGHFWGFLETRPYMRARQGLAVALWALGQHQEAIGHCQAMLELNPNDNQGIRYLLAGYLLALGLTDALKQLLGQFEDDGTAMWLYTRALLAFRENSPEADRLVEAAWSENSYVPEILSGRRPMVASQDGYITLGGEDEAGEYVKDNGEAWRATPGAIEWLNQVTSTLQPKPQGGRPGRR
jgi:tetratricopeptide (TPR) repeat protein